MSQSRAEELIDRYKGLHGARGSWDSFWQVLHDYFYVEGDNVTAEQAPGSEIHSPYLYDSTSLNASDVLASGFMNYLTPPSSKWFRMTHNNPAKREKKVVMSFLEDVAAECQYTLERSNFYQVMFSIYKGSGVYGTSIILAEEDTESVVRYVAPPLKTSCIYEDSKGRVNGYFFEFSFTASQVADRFGPSALTTELKEELTAGKDEPHKFLLFIGKRGSRDITKVDKSNMPIEAVWVNVEGKSIVDDGGYHEMPCVTHRFDKRYGEVWGYSPGMKALPWARMVNAIAKTNLRSMMKQTDPPIALPSNAFISPFSANPRAINYYKNGSLKSGNEIFPFGNYGHPEVGIKALEMYQMQVKIAMYNDVFLAFETLTKQMNNPEVYERINEKMTMLGPAVGRYTNEMLDPMLTRLVGILYRAGRLPPVPDELMDEPIYEIVYTGQLAQAQKRSELNAYTSALSMAGSMAQMDPTVLDKIDRDKAIDILWDITGAPKKMLRPDSEVAKMREARAKQQVAQQEIMMAQGAAKAAKDASAAKDLIGAGSRQVFE